MAEILLPNALVIESESLSLVWPGQRSFESIFTGENQILARGVGRFVGEVRFAATEASFSSSQRRAVEGFLASLAGQNHTFRLPRLSPSKNTLSDDSAPIATSSSVVGNSVDVSIADAPAGSFEYGDYVEIADRLFQVTASISGGVATLAPGIDFPDDSPIEVLAPRALMRRSNADPVIPSSSGDFIGPWTIAVEEVI